MQVPAGRVYNHSVLVVDSAGSLWSRSRRAVARVIRALPLITQVGLSLLLVGFGVDVVAHISSPTGSLALAGHLVTLAGMALAVSGSVGVALRRPAGDGPDGRRT
ncbi:MAG: hypothetical protein M3135_00615 [Actinomycetota bacterium]|nr:hypothetical protein [Actinomycetota bacterium]